ncbi:MAG TPA: PIN-like domain-containing protein [Acidiferrobacter sp.]|nr:PIN-like domain-containing protein [Acidiferrobacter sp.]
MFGEISMKQTMREYLDGLGAFTEDDKTLVFFDTNILSYLHRLHAAAREEFFGWTDILVNKDRLRIPAWAAHEYLCLIKKDRLKDSPNKALIGQLENALRAVLESASLFVDDEVLKGKALGDDRDNVLKNFKGAITQLQKYSPLFRHKSDFYEIHGQIQEHFSSVIMNSNIAELCVRAGREGPIRTSHRLPPAFCDTDKDENPLGDLIIWFEIMGETKTHESEYDKVLFVTNDEKSDWVYTPRFRMEHTAQGSKMVSNSVPVLKVIDPRLSAEFRHMGGAAQVMICNLQRLIESLSTKNPEQFKHLASAIQINVDNVDDGRVKPETSAVEIAESEMIGPSVVDEGDVGETRQPEGQSERLPCIEQGRTQAAVNGEGHHLTYGPEALRDRAYEDDDGIEIDGIIRELRTRNWYRQNPAMQRLKAIWESTFRADSWFVLGRNIYQAADGHAQKAQDFMRDLDIHLDHFLPETRGHLLAGMLFEVYFDNAGALRQIPKASFFEPPWRLADTDQFRQVQAWIRQKLDEAGSQLKLLPGDRNKVPLILISRSGQTVGGHGSGDRYDLKSAKIGGIELMKCAKTRRQKRATPDSVLRAPPSFVTERKQEWSVNDLVEHVSHVFVIPRTRIERCFKPSGVRPDAMFRVQDNCRLDFWGAFQEWCGEALSRD